MEDPLTYVKQVNQSAKQELVLRKASLPLELVGCTIAAACSAGTDQELWLL